MDLPNDVGARLSVRDRVNDQYVRNALQDDGSQLVPSPDWNERVLRTQNNCEVLVELTGEVRYDVHAVPIRMS